MLEEGIYLGSRNSTNIYVKVGVSLKNLLERMKTCDYNVSNSWNFSKITRYMVQPQSLGYPYKDGFFNCLFFLQRPVESDYCSKN